jgi:outer membrane receptor protein involved in Fe transport
VPQFKFSDELMLYARFASGYRPGGPNALPAVDGAPTYDPDFTKNYEIGFKGTPVPNVLSLNASVYYIKWDDIQLQATTPIGLAFIENGGKAKSEGAQLEVQLSPGAGFTISGWIAYNEAELTEPTPPTAVIQAPAGTPLPVAPRWTGHVAVEDRVPLRGQLTLLWGGDVSYVGARTGALGQPTQDPLLTGYWVTNLHVGAEYASWRANLFANNVADRRGLLSNFAPAFVFIIPPRTVGITLSRDF